MVADQHAGLQEALGRELGSVAVQRCVCHWLRNAGTRISKKEARPVLAQLKGFFIAEDLEQARQLPQLADWMEETVEDCLVCYALPAEQRKQMRTTNCLERVDQEVRRRLRPMRVLSNRQSLRRIVAAVLVDQDEKWVSQKWRWLSTPPQPLGKRRSRSG